MGIDYEKCEDCDGDGSVWIPENNATGPCRACGGMGYRLSYPKDDSVKVVRLYDGKPVEASPPVDEVLVAKLEELLYAARAGEFFSFAIVTEMASKAAANTFHVRRGGSRIVLLGALSRLEHSIHEDIDGDDGR